jgi:ABC-type transport system substrate-binding protein
MKRKLLALVFVLALAISSFAALGAGGASANTPELEVGLNSPQGSHTVVGPAEATGGAVTAFTNVTNAGVEIDNIDVSFDGGH